MKELGHINNSRKRHEPFGHNEATKHSDAGQQDIAKQSITQRTLSVLCVEGNGHDTPHSPCLHRTDFDCGFPIADHRILHSLYFVKYQTATTTEIANAAKSVGVAYSHRFKSAWRMFIGNQK
ncbi:hypothetical protein KOR42_28830 [Thalassoglobus neptunius]|uniref:Uncharacterized protein n=1 Tax=Thalassoglobus neptunius TaxID=1938619 RepID=A0A5C5WX13_9PLAN|nr:hypothetical protein KOR42_28830 [Thalassoglobus neptunius]